VKVETKGIASFTVCIQGLVESPLLFLPFMFLLFVELLCAFFATGKNQSDSLCSIENESCQCIGCTENKTRQVHLKIIFGWEDCIAIRPPSGLDHSAVG
jgi:hypothetical protein